MSNESDLLIADAMRVWTKARFGDPAGDVGSAPRVLGSASEPLLVPARLTLAVAHWTRGGRRIWTAPREASSMQQKVLRRPP